MTTKITESTKMIKALIALDYHPHLASALMSTAFELSQSHASYLSIPMQKGIPDWLNKVIILDRIDKVADEVESGVVGELSTPSEVLGFLYYCNSKEQLSENWSKLYFALLRMVAQKYKLSIPDCLNIPEIDITQVLFVFLELATTVRKLLIEGGYHE